jgi:hypothetical protein
MDGPVGGKEVSGRIAIPENKFRDFKFNSLR